MGRDYLGDAKAARGDFAKDKPLIAAGRTNPRVLIPLVGLFRKRPRMGRDYLGDAKVAWEGFAKDKPLIAAGRTNPRVLIPLGGLFRKRPRMGRDSNPRYR